MKPEDLKEMNEIPWWHTMELDGVWTKGKDFTMTKLNTLKFPKDLKGKRVIDIGAWDGFFSFECERRGADVLAVDSPTYSWNPEGITIENKFYPNAGKKGFNFAHKILNSKVRTLDIELPELKHSTQKYNLVLCLGILYHMKDPLGMIQIVYDLCENGGLCILETHADLFNIERPVLAFYPNDECNKDFGTWFGPNPACIEAMLKVVGFKDIEKIYEDKFHRVVYHARK